MAWFSRFYLHKLIIALILALYFGRFLFIQDRIIDTFLHGFLLVLHEAGHFLTPFGDFAMILGGTLWQIFVPLVIAIYFVLSRQFYSAAVVLFLVSFSLVDASVYVRDARERLLPLTTVDPNTHDWWNLLRRLQLLEYDDTLANLYRLQGWCFYALASVLAVFFSQRHAKGLPF
jgi:hypothetical protein